VPGITPPGGLNVLPVGTVLAGRYRVIGLIGVGAVGMVYRAHDERLHVDVALKVLRPEKVPDVRVLERFEQELVLGRQVSHRNVVRIHDIGQHGELHFLTMDHVDGRSLRQILDERGRLEVGEAVAIARDLAEALSAAHAQQVVHRDLKPANVLVDSDGRAYITDFGVARSMLLHTGLTKRGNIVGTLDYLAPEQAQGGDIDGRTDIYALGLMLFEMLTGQAAFHGESPGEILAARSAGRRRSLRDTGVLLPRWLRRLVSRCLAANPEKRYQNAAALAADLAAGKLRRRSRPGRIALFATAAAAVAGLVVAGWWWYGETKSAAVPAMTPTVAVLPLATPSDDADAAWLSTGLAEMLSQALAESPNLQVADSVRVLRTLRDLDLAPAQLPEAELARLAELLDVERLVTGTVQPTDSGLSVELNLVATPNEGTALKTVRADGRLADLPALSHQLAGQMAAALAVPPLPATTSSHSSKSVALAAYARGVELLAKNDTVAAGMAFEEAVAADPAFAAAWVRLAGAYRSLGYDDRALESARQAVARLPDSSGRLGWQARVLEAALAGDIARAQQQLAAAVAQHPHDIEIRLTLAEAYAAAGKYGRARKELEQVVAASPHHPRAWLLLGQYAVLAGDAGVAASEYLPRALAIHDRLGDIAGRADAQNALGAAHAALGNLDEARTRYLNAADLNTRVGDEPGVAVAVANAARIRIRQGRLDDARRELQDAVATAERIGSYPAAANLHVEIGALDERRGRYREALERYEKSLAIRQDLDDPRALAASYGHIGFVHYELGEYDDAAFYANGAMEIFQKAADRQGQAEAAKTVSLLALARGQWATAEQRLLQLLNLGRELDDASTQAFALGQLGRAAQAQGKFGAALAAIVEGREVIEPAGDARGLAELLLLQADLAFELGMLDSGREALAKADGLINHSGSAVQRAEWWRLAGTGHLRAAQIEDARRAFARARAHSGLGGSATVRLATEIGAAEAVLEAGEAKTARDTLQHLHAEANMLGQVALQLRSGELLARAQAKSGRPGQAEKQLRACLSIASSHPPWSGRYRLQAELAEVLSTLGRKSDAAAQFRAAGDEVERLRKGLDASQRHAFEQLDEVRKLADRKDGERADTPSKVAAANS
jgi:tetratricopeptide (TPR) repeat protein